MGSQTEVSIFRVFLMLSGNFYGSEIRHGTFLGFCLKPKGFLWVLIFALIRSSLSDFKSGVPPWGAGSMSQ